eukprot:NODE_24935_length_605_cov_2.443515.p2 GENE.NODE_24935_length_605_cov_2.443515~~NODE_24935_length_605_cov_2.443515.p2  ORF type:complete len:108 (-),score=14.04 NODE_24935_length_605_cov_2.443515:59-382(-)
MTINALGHIYSPRDTLNLSRFARCLQVVDTNLIDHDWAKAQDLLLKSLLPRVEAVLVEMRTPPPTSSLRPPPPTGLAVALATAQVMCQPRDDLTLGRRMHAGLRGRG